MSLGDFLVSSVAGVDKNWVAKLRHIHRLIEQLQNEGWYIKYQYDKNMTLIILFKLYPESDEVYLIEYEYLEIDEAIRMVTKWKRGHNAIETIDEWQPYKIGFLFEDQVPSDL